MLKAANPIWRSDWFLAITLLTCAVFSVVARNHEHVAVGWHGTIGRMEDIIRLAVIGIRLVPVRPAIFMVCPETESVPVMPEKPNM